MSERKIGELTLDLMRAGMRFEKTDRGRQCVRPPTAPHGFRYAPKRVEVARLDTRRISLKSFPRMRRAPDNLDGVVARVLKKIATGRLVITRRR